MTKKEKTFSKLKKGDSLWVFDNINNYDNILRECTIKKVERVKPATLPAYSDKWIVHTNEKPFQIIFTLENGDWHAIKKDNFDKSALVMAFDRTNLECEIIGTSKDALKERLCSALNGVKSFVDYQLKSYLPEFEK